MADLARGLLCQNGKRFVGSSVVRHKVKMDEEPLPALAAWKPLLEKGQEEEDIQFARLKLARGRESAMRAMQGTEALGLPAIPADSYTATLTGREGRRLEAMQDARGRGRVKGRGDLLSYQGCKGEYFLEDLVIGVQLLDVPSSGNVAPVS